MSQPARPADRPIPVECRVCHTRMYAGADQVGKQVQCPDCHSLSTVPPPPPEKAPFKPEYTGDEYRLQEEDPPRQNAVDPASLVRVVCGTCFTLMHARPEHVGKRIRCPDCGSLTTVPRPKQPGAARPPIDVSDVNLQESAPPPIDNTRKEVAARLLAQANAHLDEHPDERVPPKRPMRDGIYTFPCYWNVIPLWVGAAFGLLVNLALFEVLLEIIQSGGLGSIMAAFLVPIFTLCLFGLVALVLPHFLTIIEFTADGYDKVPHWPSQDFLSRMHAMLLGINALAMSTAPGMLLLLPFRSLGMPLWPGVISTILLLPLVVLSMLETNSVFIPYSKFVFGSLFRVPLAWQQFYVQVLLLAAGILAVDYAVWQVSVEASRVVTVFTVTVYAVIYARLVGRIAYVLGQLETDEPVDEDEDADEEEEARG